MEAESHKDSGDSDFRKLQERKPTPQNTAPPTPSSVRPTSDFCPLENKLAVFELAAVFFNRALSKLINVYSIIMSKCQGGPKHSCSTASLSSIFPGYVLFLNMNFILFNLSGAGFELRASHTPSTTEPHPSLKGTLGISFSSLHVLSLPQINQTKHTNTHLLVFGAGILLNMYWLGECCLLTLHLLRPSMPCCVLLSVGQGLTVNPRLAWGLWPLNCSWLRFINAPPFRSQAVISTDFMI